MGGGVPRRKNPEPRFQLLENAAVLVPRRKYPMGAAVLVGVVVGR